jgi:hypothetical protein
VVLVDIVGAQMTDWYNFLPQSEEKLHNFEISAKSEPNGFSFSAAMCVPERRVH